MGKKGAAELDGGDVTGLVCGEQQDASRFPACGLSSFCLRSSCHSLKEPISLVRTEVLWSCCDEDEDPCAAGFTDKRFKKKKVFNYNNEQQL